jgi:hypothetical protein
MFGGRESGKNMLLMLCRGDIMTSEPRGIWRPPITEPQNHRKEV